MLQTTNKDWQQELAAGVSNSAELCRYLDLPADCAMPDYAFALRVPYSFVHRMEPGNSDDPLLKQVLPVAQEAVNVSGYSNDPVGDLAAMVVPGVIHKYPKRVLLITSGACAINCRYCFRRNFPYADSQLSATKLQQALHYIENQPAITEVILSGGDPLLLSDQKLFALLQQLAGIKHLDRIRIHTRIPIVLPNRISPAFCEQLRAISKPIVVVVHANHQNELNTEVQIACQQMRQRQITLLNQSVLLKGINDDALQLCALSEKLFAFGVMPYYLHLLDRAHGTAHFAVSQASSLAIMGQVKKQLPGYLVPKLVQERAGAESKIVIA